MNLDAATLTAIAALVGSLVAIGKLTFDKRKTEIDVHSAIVHSATELVDDLREEIKRLRDERKERDATIKTQNVKIMKLELELHQAWERITALESEVEYLKEGLNGQT